MEVSKNKVLSYGEFKLFILDYVEYRGTNYMLTARLNENGDNITDEMFILEEVSNTDKLYAKRVTDPEVLKYLRPIFEHNIEQVKLAEEE